MMNAIAAGEGTCALIVFVIAKNSFGQDQRRTPFGRRMNAAGRP